MAGVDSSSSAPLGSLSAAATASASFEIRKHHVLQKEGTSQAIGVDLAVITEPTLQGSRLICITVNGPSPALFCSALRGSFL